jgi:hypothetical protein
MPIFLNKNLIITFSFSPVVNYSLNFEGVFFTLHYLGLHATLHYQWQSIFIFFLMFPSMFFFLTNFHNLATKNRVGQPKKGIFFNLKKNNHHILTKKT